MIARRAAAEAGKKALRLWLVAGAIVLLALIVFHEQAPDWADWEQILRLRAVK